MKVVQVAVLTLIALGMVGVALAYTVQTDNKGAPQITLYGGKSGPVPFPHAAHQAVLDDCTVCHALFPQETGAIEALKASGELKRKQVMNKHCTKCHKKMKKAGQKTGPTTCKSCHVKNG